MLSTILFLLDTDEKRSKFEFIYNEHHQKMYNIAFGITQDPYDAESALNSSLFIIAENIDKVETESEQMLKSYLYKIVKNASIKIVNDKKKRPVILDYNSYIKFSTDGEKEIIENCYYNELVCVIKNMPSTYRDVLVLHYLHGFSATKISVILQRNVLTVKKQLFRGNKLLREAIKGDKYD